jgi:hypothetical protein
MPGRTTGHRGAATAAVLLVTLATLATACGRVRSPSPAATVGAPPIRTASAGAGTASPVTPWSIVRGEARSDQLWGVDVDAAGSVYATGYFQSPASAPFFDVVTYRFDPNGSEVWRSQWGEAFEEKAFVVTVDQPLVLVGGEQRASLDFGRSRLLLLALDAADGGVEWTWAWDSGHGYHEIDGLVVDGDAIYLSGWTGGATTSGDVVIARLDRATGREAWVKTWGGEAFDEADGQMVVDDRFLYISGRYDGQPLTGGRALLAKFDKATGEEVAHVTWGDGSFDDGLGMTSDGTSLYVVGLTVGGGNGQIFLRAFDKDLVEIWDRTWGGPAGEAARAAAIDRDGNILVAGTTFSSGAGKDDIVLLAWDPAGGLLWERVWGGAGRDSAHGLVVDGDAAYIAGETENGAAGQTDGLLIRVDAAAGRFPEIAP